MVATNFPTGLDNPTDPSPSSPTLTPSHSGLHDFANDAIVALEQVIVGPSLFNVKGYGAAGNNSTDDTADIQTTISAASVGGGVVFFPAGTYLVSKPLQVPSNVAVVGAGIGASTIKMKSGSWSGVTQVGSINGVGALMTAGNTTASNIVIRSITIDGNQTGVTAIPTWANGSNTCSPLHLNYITGLMLDQVQVVNSIGYGVYLQGDVRFVVKNCDIITGQVSATQGWGTPTTQDGLHIADSTYGVIDGNYIDTGTYTTNVGDDAIALQSYAAVHDITISDNVLRSAEAAIDLALSGSNIYDVTITGNTIFASQNGAVINQPFIASSAISYNITVTGNTITNAVSTANSNKAAICLLDYASISTPAQGWANWTISGNTISGINYGSAIYARYGNTLTVTDNSIYNCTVSEPVKIGDYISGSCPVTNFTVVGNSVNASAGASVAVYGIVVIDSLNGTIGSNTVIGPSGPVSGSAGIVLYTQSTDVTGVSITGNRTNIFSLGIWEATGGDYNVIVGNNTHGSTSSVTTSGAHTVAGNNL